MRIGVIAEGHADIAVIRAVLKALKGIDGSDIVAVRPSELYDETDLHAMNFSNWNLVLQSCGDEALLQSFFDGLDEEALLIVQIDTAERAEAGYDIVSPLREKEADWRSYSKQVYDAVKERMMSVIPEGYKEKMIYAIAIEETDAWLIPLFDRVSQDTAQYANPKEHLRKLVGKMDKGKRIKYVNTAKKNLDYVAIAKGMRKELDRCREKNFSLNLFCIDIERLMQR